MSVAEHFLFIWLLDWATAGRSYGRFMAIRHKLKLPTYIQEPLVIGWISYLQRVLNGKTVSSR